MPLVLMKNECQMQIAWIFAMPNVEAQGRCAALSRRVRLDRLVGPLVEGVEQLANRHFCKFRKAYHVVAQHVS
jgi:hypothetical protein